MSDGFVCNRAGSGWEFHHNQLNGETDDTVFNPSTGNYDLPLGPLSRADLDSFAHAFSLNNAELFHQGLLDALDDGASDAMNFTECLQAAIATNSTFTMVLPEFQYMRPPATHTGTINADDHVVLGTLVSDVTQFLENVFVNNAYNGGSIPNDFVLEISNEFSANSNWNSYFFTPAAGHELDGYSAYAIGVLTAVESFRDNNPAVEFRVAMQANSGPFVNEIASNFESAGVEHIFGEMDVINVVHNGLDSDLAGNGAWGNATALEDHAANIWGPIQLQRLIDENGGDSSAVEIYMLAWSARSWDIYPENTGGAGNPDNNHMLPAAGATLALFSSMFEMGINMAAN